MAQNKLNLIWIDLEMTGLDTVNDHIIEIATIVTSKNLKVLAEGPVFAIKQPASILSKMDDWNTKTHGESGLIDRIKTKGVSLKTAEAKTIKFLKEYVPAGISPMCGNSICQDRRFLHREMPKLYAYFHYRNLDVSTLKELAARWAPKLLEENEKQTAHTALADVRESIDELKFYRKNFIKKS